MRSKQNSYHVMNKNIAPSNIIDSWQKKEGMPSGASPSLDAWESLNITLVCLGHPQAQALVTPYSIIHRDLTQNLKTSAHKTQQKTHEIYQYNKTNHHFRYCCKPIHILLLHYTYVILSSPWLIPPIQYIDSSKTANNATKTESVKNRTVYRNM